MTILGSKETYPKGGSAWAGDLGGGICTGGPEEPRMTFIEVNAKYVAY